MYSLKALWPSVSFCISSIQTAFMQLTCLEVCLGGFSSSCRVSVLHTASLVHPGERQTVSYTKLPSIASFYNPFTTQLVKAAQLNLTLFLYSRFLSIWWRQSGQVVRAAGFVQMGGSRSKPSTLLLTVFVRGCPCSTLRLHFLCFQLVCLLPCMIRKFIKNVKKRKYVFYFFLTV